MEINYKKQCRQALNRRQGYARYYFFEKYYFTRVCKRQQRNQIGYTDISVWKNLLKPARFLLIILFKESLVYWWSMLNLPIYWYG